jgi:pimeloyl-ACP methyl ester carboxylesterase
MDTFQRDGLTFDVSDTGPAGGRVVIALHGFPEDRHCWQRLAEGLTAGPAPADQPATPGYRILAPDQRGYSPGARPRGRRTYALTELTADVLALADAAGAARFDVIGHDWGGGVAWDLAARHPDRVRTLTVLSTPHPGAMTASLLRSSQLLHSWYMLFFQLPAVPEAAMRRAGAARAAERFVKDGLDADSARRYAERLVRPETAEGPLNWYRAIPYSFRRPMPPVTVPTLYVWSDGDGYLTRRSAELTEGQVTGPYRFEILRGLSHWLPTAAADQLVPMVRDHLASVPAG